MLYVAITRAKTNLHLLAPLKFYVTQQRRFGERHLYGARSRFLTEPVLATCESVAWPTGGAQAAGQGHAVHNVRVDAAAQLRAMWD